MKQFHIISVGNSLLSNLKNKKEELKNIPFSDEEKWRKYLDNPSFLNEVYNFLSENPRKNSGELNSFLSFIEKENKENVHIYLVGTNTASNNISKYTIERFLKKIGYTIYDPAKFSGYFWEAESYDSRYAREEFSKDMGLLLDRIIVLVRKKQQEGFEVYINPTGGFKPHVVVAALAGFLTGCRVYYIHEEFRGIIEFPRLFYLPKGREIELLKELSDKTPRSGNDFDKLQKGSEDEIERLKYYGLVDTEKDEYGKEYRIKITERGLLFYNFIKKEEA